MRSVCSKDEGRTFSKIPKMMASSVTTITPEVLWAQRPDELYVTINAPDVPEPTITLTKNQLKFEGTNTSGKKYAVTLDFLKEVDTEVFSHAFLPLLFFLSLKNGR
ncbi:hypothetical protein BC830DRAFT_1087616 [Chytriomyces sp. MP71]|nr:hypothetical protein BC830DRAFT_1087616 [Chytriomyces sp. MP71]